MSKNMFYKMLRKIQNIAVNSRISGVKEMKFLRSKIFSFPFFTLNLPSFYPKFTHFLPTFYPKFTRFLLLIFLFLCAMIILAIFEEDVHDFLTRRRKTA